MAYYERIGNLHIHTHYSDGTAEPASVAHAAQDAGLDFVIITDHNAYHPEHAGWYDKVLLLVGQEIHAPDRSHENHLLVFGAKEELVSLAGDPQALVTAVHEQGGLSFLAHPYEHSGTFSNEPEINWRRWDVQGFDGIELWNYMSEFKSHCTEAATALLYAFWPKLAIMGPYPETLARWDALLGARRIGAVGGSDAHGTTYRLGPIRRRVFGYQHCFRALNTHLLLSAPWHNDLPQDARLVYEALSLGRAFVAYDALAPARGFQFWAETGDTRYTLGDEFVAHSPVRFVVQMPRRAHIRLIANGYCVAKTMNRVLTYCSDTPGAYRVEALRPYLFRSRGWIYSNAIYVRSRRHRPKDAP